MTRVEATHQVLDDDDREEGGGEAAEQQQSCERVSRSGSITPLHEEVASSQYAPTVGHT